MLSLFGREPAPPVDAVAATTRTVLSFAAHVTLSVIVVTLAHPAAPAAPRPAMHVARLVHLIYVPPIDDAVLPPPRPTVVRDVATPAPMPPLVPVADPEPLAAEIPKAPEVTAVEVVAPPPPVTAPPPAPTTGVFPESKPVAARAPELGQRVESAGFDPRVHARASSQPGPPAVGAFDLAPDAGPRRQPQRSDVADAGFNRASTPASAPQPNGAVRDSGFSAEPVRERSVDSRRAEIKTAGFADARSVEPVRRADTVAARPSVIPVEVLSKPTPVYTDEGRRLKVEGEVVLEVEFAAEGSLRVLRIVRGLGHGLDEAAKRAAEQIRFRPATSEGQPVDYRTTVQIVFRLA